MKKISGYDNYCVDEYGAIYNIKTKRFLKNQLRKDGYLYIGLHKKGVQTKYAIHRLVASAYHTLSEVAGYTVNHIDGNKQNNHYLNLEWCTRRENIQHSFKIGLHKLGEKHHKSKLSSIDIKTIKRMYKQGEKQHYIAKLFNIGQDHVSRIVNKKRRIRG